MALWDISQYFKNTHASTTNPLCDGAYPIPSHCTRVAEGRRPLRFPSALAGAQLRADASRPWGRCVRHSDVRCLRPSHTGGGTACTPAGTALRSRRQSGAPRPG
eukprot:scaffold102688_cov75-Phaeocystis_antarctica.AAC.1